MSLRVRLLWMAVLVTLLPAGPAALVTRQLIRQSLDLGLSPPSDAALEAGIASMRRELQRDREALGALARAWAAAWVSADTAAAEAGPPAAHTVVAPGGARAGDRVVVYRGDDATIVRDGDPALAEAAPSASGREPPRRLQAEATVPGGRLVVIRSVDPAWREDAAALASQLQLVRGLQSERRALERSFWFPFIAIYGVALSIGLILALRLGRGITLPVRRLVEATDAVATGHWDVQVSHPGAGEIGRLTRGFNSMVHTLDAQSRALADLKAMAGWREMARALAHEVKNPLTPIQLTVEEMQQRYRGNDPEYRAVLEECVRIIVEEVASLRRVVERFREFSRPVEPCWSRVDLKRLLEDVAALQRDLQVELDVADDVGWIEADGDRLRQVLMNLAENARHATRDRQHPRLDVTARRTATGVVLVVEDDGPGIAPAERERVFEPYRSGAAGGLGLGLALVKGIVLAHHGTITAGEGRLGGARFQIELPARRVLDPAHHLPER